MDLPERGGGGSEASAPSGPVLGAEGAGHSCTALLPLHPHSDLIYIWPWALNATLLGVQVNKKP